MVEPDAAIVVIPRKTNHFRRLVVRRESFGNRDHTKIWRSFYRVRRHMHSKRGASTPDDSSASLIASLFGMHTKISSPDLASHASSANLPMASAHSPAASPGDPLRSRERHDCALSFAKRLLADVP